jgi:PAS domain S-box-containing protein
MRTGVGLRLLLIEDSEEDSILLVRELTRAGYRLEMHRVFTPEDLRSALSERTWDIAISDWSMPRLDGLEAYRIVREREADLPFIIVSGTIGEEIAVDALKAGVDDFMSKGRFARLGPAIERARNAARTRRAQRETAAELECRRLEIERSERLLRVVLDSVPDCVVVADRDGRVLATNPAAATLFDLDTTPESLEALDQQYDMLQADDTPLPRTHRPLTQALAGNTVERAQLFVRPRSASESRFMRVSARPFSQESGVAGAVAVFHDITRERQAQEQLIISDRMASVGMLAAGVAHEINNPLAAVLANVELMATIVADDPIAPADLQDLREMLNDARVAADRVRQIVRDLKVFSRHEVEVDHAVDLQAVLDSTLRMARNEIRHRARLVTSYGETPPARGSESRLGQVFLNLIVNAAQAIPEGRADRNVITVATRTEDGKVIVEISDTGTGMSPDTLRRLFTPFFTTKPQGEGTGLGLAIAHRIVTGLGGAIEVHSKLDEGSTFRVSIPAMVRTPRRPTIEVRAAAGKRARVLVIDDEAMIGAAIGRMLRRDHEVYAVTRAAEALDRIRNGEKFDIIVCDLMMPQMTGMEFFAEVAPFGLSDRIIFLTGGAFTPAARQFLDSVPNRYLEKPFDAAQLRALIDERAK